MGDFSGLREEMNSDEFREISDHLAGDVQRVAKFFSS